MERPLVTIITVTYNSSKYIRDAIESVLAQSYTNIEYIIGDDCSTDDTWSIIQEYKDARIITYRNDKNLKEYPNRNKSFAMANGEYVIFIDGDDMIYPHGLEFMVNMLHAFPDCGMALMLWYKRNLFYPIVISPLQFYIGIYFGYGFNAIAFANMLIRTAALKAIGGLTEEFRSGDDHARLSMGARFNTLLINDNLTWWRETSGQASSKEKNTAKGIAEWYRLYMLFLEESTCPLEKNEKEIAAKNLKISVAQNLRRLLIKGSICIALQVKKHCEFSIMDCFLALESQVKKDPFQEFTPDNPARLSFERNPYSKYTKH